MGNFEKLSVLVIGVIIVMILVVALYTWTDDPAEPVASASTGPAGGLSIAKVGGGDDLGGGADATDEEPGTGWLTWTEETEGGSEDPVEIRPLEERDLIARADSEADQPQAGEPRLGQPGRREPSAEQPAERTYTVKQGQTLSHISLEVYGTVKHWPKIAERNNVDPGRLRKGQVLILPAIDRASPASNNKPIVASVRGSGPRPGGDYVVRDGDTIQKISQGAFGTIERWDDIWIANLERVEDPRFLRTGMTLRIPN